ncbi:hypothetical protein [Marinobacter sp.]|uniref:Flp family type IVb pilin n=1 Tax=Marinobacter sp. TaxID=50741 RepID=UPI002B2791FD|nr:hypothetical protein [Marinobacter sp.]
MKLDKTVVARIRNAAPKKQKGASSLEYIMLAGVLVAILVVVSQSGIGAEFSTWFKGIFTEASDVTGT